MSTENQPNAPTPGTCEYCTKTAEFWHKAGAEVCPEHLLLTSEELDKVIKDDVQVEPTDMDVGC